MTRRALRWWIGHWRPLLPVNVGLVLLALVGVGHDSWPAWWPTAGAAGAGVTLCGWLEIQRRADFASYRRLTQPVAAVLAAGSISSAWLALSWARGINGPRLLLWAILVAATEVPWWWWRRTRGKVRVGGSLLQRVKRLPPSRAKRRPLQEVVRSWSDIVSGTRATASRPMLAEETAHGYRIKVGNVAGEDLVASMGHLATQFRTRRGGVHIRPITAHADQAWVIVSHVDPLSAVRGCPDPDPGRSIMDPIQLGVDETGEPVTLNLVPAAAEPVYLLLAGQKGSGKSGILQVLVRNLVACRDVRLQVADLKWGMEFEPWRRCLDRLETEVSGTVALLQDLLVEMEARGRQKAGTGRCWEPSEDAPALVGIVDEFADLADHMALVFEIARKGRAVGVILVLATQRPSEKAMGDGGTDTRSQFDAQIACRLRRGDEALIFGSEMRSAGWITSGFAESGCFLLSSPQHPEPRPARAYLVTDEQIRGDVARYGRASATQMQIEPSKAVRLQVSKAEYATRAGVSESHAYTRLRQLVEAGRATRIRPGLWEIDPDIIPQGGRLRVLPSREATTC